MAGELDLERVRRQVLSSLEPVRPLAPAWVWISALVIIFVAVAVAGAAGLGFYGVRALNGVQLVVIFGLLVAAGVAAAIAIAREMVPAGIRVLHPAVLAAISIALFAAAVALLFHDYSMVQFARGVSCLRAGLIFAVPSAALFWTIVRRGFVLDRVAAGVAVGMLAGLAGLGVLEFHCPILTAPHVLVWHVAVLALSAGAGAIAGKCGRRFRLPMGATPNSRDKADPPSY